MPWRSIMRKYYAQMEGFMQYLLQQYHIPCTIPRRYWGIKDPAVPDSDMLSPLVWLVLRRVRIVSFLQISYHGSLDVAVINNKLLQDRYVWKHDFAPVFSCLGFMFPGFYSRCFALRISLNYFGSKSIPRRSETVIELKFVPFQKVKPASSHMTLLGIL